MIIYSTIYGYHSWELGFLSAAMNTFSRSSGVIVAVNADLVRCEKRVQIAVFNYCLRTKLLQWTTIANSDRCRLNSRPPQLLPLTLVLLVKYDNFIELFCWFFYVVSTNSHYRRIVININPICRPSPLRLYFCSLF